MTVARSLRDPQVDPAAADAARELVARARALLDRVVRLQPGPTSAEYARQLAAIVDRIDRDEALGPEPWTYTTSPAGRRAVEFAGGGPRRDTTWATFNPIAPPLTLTVEEGCARGRVETSAVFYGPPGRVHGGVVATLLDHTMGSMLNLLGRASYTARLTIDYLSPAPLGAALDLAAGIERAEGRRTFTWGTIHADGTLIAHANGLFALSDPGVHIDEGGRA